MPKSPKSPKKTREGWFNEAVLLLQEKYFNKPRLKLPPKILVGCGMGKRLGRTLGLCWDTAVTKDSTTHIFICPSLEDPVEILGILMHELVHASVGIRHGHGNFFKAACSKLGLEGKATCATAKPNTKLHSELTAIAKELGPYSHSPIKRFEVGSKKTNQDKYVTLISKSDSRYTMKIKISVLAKFGPFKDHKGEDLVVKT